MATLDVTGSAHCPSHHLGFLPGMPKLPLPEHRARCSPFMGMASGGPWMLYWADALFSVIPAKPTSFLLPNLALEMLHSQAALTELFLARLNYDNSPQVSAKLGRLSPAASRAVGCPQAGLNPRFLCIVWGFCCSWTVGFHSPLQLAASLPHSSRQRMSSWILLSP